MAKFRFTNVFRDLDRGTRWYILNIAAKRLTPGEYLFNTILYRMFNKISTAEALGLPLARWSHKEVEYALIQIDVPWTGAHMTRLTVKEAMDSLDNVWPQKQTMAENIQYENDCYFAYLYLRANVYGGGEFTAHQWVQDLRHTPILRTAPDGPNWAHPGPGCRAGLLCMGLPPTGIAMREIYSDQSQKGTHVPKLELKDVQQSLCEYQKYVKLWKMVHEGKRCKYRIFDTPERSLL